MTIRLIKRTVGYTVVALNQTVQTCFSPNGHVNYLEELSRRLKRRDGLVILKRLTILLDDASEKGTGLVHQYVLTVIHCTNHSYRPRTTKPRSWSTISWLSSRHHRLPLRSRVSNTH